MTDRMKMCGSDYRGTSGYVLESEERRQLSPGVTLTVRRYTNPEGLGCDVYAVCVAAGAAAGAAVGAAPQGRTKTVPEHAAELEAAGRHVLAAVNADFFKFFTYKTLDTYGMQIVDGNVIREPNASLMRYGNNWFGMTDNGRYVMGDTAEYNEWYKGHLVCGVGGGFRIMRGGLDTQPLSSHDLSRVSNSPREPRTAVGISPEGGFALICADGRSERSAGASYSDLNQFFTELEMGITDVLNLDGGGSTALVAREESEGELRVINVPASTPQRPVADVIAVVLPDDNE